MTELPVNNNSAAHLPLDRVRRLFLHHGLGAVQHVAPVRTGFTNRLHDVDGRYILKVCGTTGNEARFAREIYLYRLFQDKLPVPRLLVADTSRRILPASYIVYPKIEGETAYGCWSRLSEKARRGIIRQVCDVLRVINTAPYGDFAAQFAISLPLRWHAERLAGLQRALSQAEVQGVLSPNAVEQVRSFIMQQHHVLDEQRVGLTYWDVHLDNLLVREERIVGLLDMERTEIMSIDYALHIVRRHSRYPRLYASEEEEGLVRDEEHTPIFGWFAEFYPELFALAELDARLDLYSLEYDLRLLCDWPSAMDLRRRLAEDMHRDGALR